ncbi:DUF6894 family protein [Bradyrhizobium neotropicale]|uniref:DUF6894 family protein n=1 Tax=Bradyrhizobium neotropicale TaxID=1497615 RepID=UPI001AD7597E|nr:hypothetical protein [Bradyrhizobium neotropicale]MBO4227717.1 hypothetical protein [Bradyrhizobium neotropicale]
MPRYFFHINGKFPFRDEVGTELRDDRAAWKEALLLTRDIETSLQPGQSWSLDAGNIPETLCIGKINLASGPGPLMTLTFTNIRPKQVRNSIRIELNMKASFVRAL